MGKITERRKVYAKVLTDKGVDLSMNYFTQPYSKHAIIEEQCKLFKFKSSNPCRTNRQAFYYSAQQGARSINK